MVNNNTCTELLWLFSLCRPSGFSLPERLVLLLQVSCSHLLVASPAVAFDRAQAWTVYDPESLSVLTELLHVRFLVHSPRCRCRPKNFSRGSAHSGKLLHLAEWKDISPSRWMISLQKRSEHSIKIAGWVPIPFPQYLWTWVPVLSQHWASSCSALQRWTLRVRYTCSYMSLGASDNLPALFRALLS